MSDTPELRCQTHHYVDDLMTATAELFGFESTLDVPVLANGGSLGTCPSLTAHAGSIRRS